MGDFDRDLVADFTRKMIINMNNHSLRQSRELRSHFTAMSLTELLCVIAILGILAALYLPAVAKAFVRILKFLGAL